MAQDRGILLFYDWLENVKDDLNGEEFKSLVYALASYKKDGEEPNNLHGVAGFAWKLLKGDIDRYNQKREAGKKGGTERAKREREAKSASSTLEGCLESASSTLEGCFNNHTIPYHTIQDNTNTIPIQYNTNVCSLPSVENCAADAPRLTEEQPKKREKAPKEDDRAEDVKRIVDHLNERCGVRYRPSTKDTRGHILARLREGYTVEDFEAVIDKMANAWIGSDMERYLRPSTLFGSKFEGYLNGNFTPRTSSKAPKDELWQYISENIG